MEHFLAKLSPMAAITGFREVVALAALLTVNRRPASQILGTPNTEATLPPHSAPPLLLILDICLYAN